MSSPVDSRWRRVERVRQMTQSFISFVVSMALSFCSVSFLRCVRGCPLMHRLATDSDAAELLTVRGGNHKHAEPAGLVNARRA